MATESHKFLKNTFDMRGMDTKNSCSDTKSGSKTKRGRKQVFGTPIDSISLNNFTRTTGETLANLLLQKYPHFSTPCPGLAQQTKATRPANECHPPSKRVPPAQQTSATRAANECHAQKTKARRPANQGHSPSNSSKNQGQGQAPSKRRAPAQQFQQKPRPGAQQTKGTRPAIPAKTRAKAMATWPHSRRTKAMI